jgi:hypothetical protein
MGWHGLVISYHIISCNGDGGDDKSDGDVDIGGDDDYKSDGDDVIDHN